MRGWSGSGPGGRGCLGWSGQWPATSRSQVIRRAANERGGGLRPQQDRPPGGHPRGRPACAGALEIPEEVVAEAIVNTVAHRDYTSNGSVQVMLLSDRLDISGPAPAVPDPGETPAGSRVGAGQPAPRRADVPDRLHRADGYGDAGHDPALRRGRPPGAGVCRQRRVPDDHPPGSGSRIGAAARVTAKMRRKRSG